MSLVWVCGITGATHLSHPPTPKLRCHPHLMHRGHKRVVSGGMCIPAIPKAGALIQGKSAGSELPCRQTYICTSCFEYQF
eukprot:1186352-Prorocentrum_minimum.AAC.6